MNFSTKTKREIMKSEFGKKSSRISLLSGFLRTSGSVETRGGLIGFSATSEAQILKYIAKTIHAVYGVEPQIFDGDREQRVQMELISRESAKILQDAKILSFDNQGISFSFEIDESLISTTEDKTAFIVGAFLGSGTVTIPTVDSVTTTGYHLEFVFSKKKTAEEFSHLFSSFGFMPKLIERKETFVVYVNNAEAVNDALTLLGAKKTSLEVTDIIIKKSRRNDVNRRINCEMSNMNKSVEAMVSDRAAIGIIEQTIGLDKLPKQLKLVAEARLNSETESLSQLADELEITKSCLAHRLRKIREIAAELE